MYVVFAQAASLAKPSRGSFGHPSFRQQHKFRNTLRSADDFMSPPRRISVLDRTMKFVIEILDVRPRHQQSREAFRSLLFDGRVCGTSVIHQRGCHVRHHQNLSAIATSLSAHLRRLHRQSVNSRFARRRFPFGRRMLPRDFRQHRQNTFPRAVVPPSREVLVHRALRR